MVNTKKAKKACGDAVSHKQYKDLRGPVVICGGNSNSKQNSKGIAEVPQLKLVLYKYLGKY